MGRSFYTFPDLSEAESPSHGRHRGLQSGCFLTDGEGQESCSQHPGSL